MTSVVIWIILIVLSISLFISRRKYPRMILSEVKKAVLVH